MKKSILIIVENMPVPFDTRVWKEATSLQKNGYEVDVLCPQGQGRMSGRTRCSKGWRSYRHPMPKEGNGALGYMLRIQLRIVLGVPVFVVDLSPAWVSGHSRLQSSRRHFFESRCRSSFWG